jgi:hypothetical protein
MKKLLESPRGTSLRSLSRGHYPNSVRVRRIGNQPLHFLFVGQSERVMGGNQRWEAWSNPNGKSVTQVFACRAPKGLETCASVVLRFGWIGHHGRHGCLSHGKQEV